MVVKYNHRVSRFALLDWRKRQRVRSCSLMRLTSPIYWKLCLLFRLCAVFSMFALFRSRISCYFSAKERW